MAIDRSELRKMAELARLQLSEAEAEGLLRDCEAILDYFRTIRQIESEDQATMTGSERMVPLREDRAEPDALHTALSELAPAWRDGYFVIPRLPAMDAESEAESQAGSTR